MKKVLFPIACTALIALASCAGSKSDTAAADATADISTAELPATLRLNVFLDAADEQKRADAIATARALIAPSQKEDGCISYDMFESVTEPGHFIIVETWASQEALDRHMKQPHFIEHATKLGDYGEMHTDTYRF